MNTCFSTSSKATRLSIKRLLHIAVLPIIAAIYANVPALAEDTYPSKTVKIVVNYPPGGPIDVVARLVANKMEGSLKRSVIVENTGGAGGNIGAANVARAAPDGHTILFSIDAPFTMNPALYPSMPFKASDLKPVTLLGHSGSTIAVNAATGVNSLKELVARAKQTPITFSSAGNASPGHIAAAMLGNDAGIKEFNHIPYRGNSPAVIAVASGEVQAGILATAGLLPHISSKKVKPLAVAGTERSVLLPDVPTTKELGFPNVQMEFMFVAVVPAKTPDTIVTTLHKEIGSALSKPDVQERLKTLDIVPENLSPTQTAERMAKAGERYRKVIESTGMKAE